MEAIKDVVTLTTVKAADEQTTQQGLAPMSSSSNRNSETSAAYPSDPVLVSEESNKRESQLDLDFEGDYHSDRIPQSNTSEDQSERFLQLNWKEMVGVLANQVTAMLKTITNQTLPVESFLQT